MDLIHWLRLTFLSIGNASAVKGEKNHNFWCFVSGFWTQMFDFGGGRPGYREGREKTRAT